MTCWRTRVGYLFMISLRRRIPSMRPGTGQGLRSSTDCPLTVTSAVQADEIARLSILSRTPAAPDAKSGEVD
jgi:hypothetical protein